MKKAQMEVFGLAMVVILVFIGMVLVITLYKPPATADLKAAYVDEVIAQNMINAIFSLNTTCSLDMAALTKNCYQGNQQYLCDGKYSCEYVNDTISNILKNTLEKWKKSYTFEVEKTDIKRSYGNCAETAAVPGYYRVVLYPEPGVILALLTICRS